MKTTWVAPGGNELYEAAPPLNCGVRRDVRSYALRSARHCSPGGIQDVSAWKACRKRPREQSLEPMKPDEPLVSGSGRSSIQ